MATFPSAVGGLVAVATAAGSYLVLVASVPSQGSNSRVRQAVVAARSRGGRFARTTDADPRLPFAIDLLAVCLRAGMPTSTALRAVASTMSGAKTAVRPGADGGDVPAVSVVFGQAAALTELGSEPAVAWEVWIGHPTYGPLARALIVTGESGSAVAGRLELVSRRLRAAASQAAIARAQRVGVALMAPLGLCFLPAFVCLGVVPVIVGIASQVFG
ncbi:MAG: type II secretion system F family protein [Geodermatophilaceae bacterium]|nr:type II secretion system F family protein [Geodermatophilaceae bacterium]